MAADASPNVNLRRAVLGLDVGMTATRASIQAFDRKNDEPIIVPAETDMKALGNAYNDCEFPSTAYPLDIHKEPWECLGYVAEGHSQSIPLKLYWALLAARQNQGRKKDHIAQKKKQGGVLKSNPAKLKDPRKLFPPVNQLMLALNHKSRKGKELKEYQRLVMKHLGNIFKEHLSQVKRQVDVIAAQKGWRITDIAATLPPLWENKLQHQYSAFLLSIWSEVSPNNVHWMGEIEAIEHWLLRKNGLCDGMMGAVLTADFGGHTLSTHVTDIVRGKAEPNRYAFFSVSDATCVYGGAELHTLWVKKQIEGQIDQRVLQFTEEEQQHLIQTCLLDYRNRRRAKITGRKFFVQGQIHEDDRTNYMFEISERDCSKMYATCFEQPLKHLHAEIRRRAGTKTAVLLTGGSFLNRPVLEQTKQKIKEAGLEYIEWTEKIRSSNNRSASASVGAALALANTITVDEFMKRAVFAIQDADYERAQETANRRVILDRGTSVGGQQQFVLDKESEIICHPYVDASSKEPGTVTEIPYDKTYVFYRLQGERYRGRYRCSLEYLEEKENQPPHLILRAETWHEPHEAPKGRPREERKLRLYYDPGQNTVFVDVEHFEEDNPTRALGRRRRTAAAAVPEDLVETESEGGDKDSDDDDEAGSFEEPFKKSAGELFRKLFTVPTGRGKAAEKLSAQFSAKAFSESSYAQAAEDCRTYIRRLATPESPSTARARPATPGSEAANSLESAPSSSASLARRTRQRTAPPSPPTPSPSHTAEDEACEVEDGGATTRATPRDDGGVSGRSRVADVTRDWDGYIDDVRNHDGGPGRDRPATTTPAQAAAPSEADVLYKDFDSVHRPGQSTVQSIAVAPTTAI
ncbi:MFS transporter [Purpureocillium lavendulum]|uniref:MFS transporter n=1 Tax=Purpureocillium lavendulum TaxID=1247861 RepID=A0AB34FK88_9HYPO|nr:MFS transporter [Purpureocillium lavendulum]